MTWHTITYLLSTIIAAVTMGFIAWYSRKQRDTVAGAGVYTWIALMVCGFSFFQGFSMAGPTEEWALFWFKLRFLPFAAIPVLWLVFVMQYIGKPDLVTKPRMAALFIVPVITQIMVWTNSQHGLWVVREIAFLRAGPFFIPETAVRILGPWYRVHTFYTYGLMLAGIIALFAVSVRLYRRYRGQAVALGAGTIIMIIGTMFPTWNFVPGMSLNPMPQGFALGSLIIAWGLFRHRFLRVSARVDREKSVPVALMTLFTALTIGILVTGFLYYRQYRDHYRTEMESRLSAIVNLKVNDIASWRGERLADGNVLYHNAVFTGLARRTLAVPGDDTARRQIHIWLNAIKTSFRYTQIQLIDARGTLRMAVPGENTIPCGQISLHLDEARRAGKVMLTDLHRDGPDRPIHLSVIVPIADGQPGTSVSGFVVMMIDPSTYLYPLLQRWPTPSRTAETLLVRREGSDALFINELKFSKNSALTLKVPLTEAIVPAVMAVGGREGVVEGIDYRGVPVIAALRAVPDSPWFMVARMDIEEVYAPVRERFWVMAIVVLALIAGAGVGMGTFWRKRDSRYVEEKLEAAEYLRESEEKFSRAFMNSPYAITITDPKDGRFIEVNEAFYSITGFTRDEAVASSSIALALWANEGDRNQVVRELMDGGKVAGREYTFIKKNGGTITGLFSADFIDLNTGKYILSSISDITGRKLMESGMRSAMELTAYAADHSADELLRKTLDEAELLTGSRIGFLHFLEADQKTLRLQMWSTNTIENMCTAEGKGSHYDIGAAGVWVDCVREQRPVIHNDYASLPGRKGMPEGHATVVRELVVPVMRNGLIMSILGVGNKPSDYDAGDIEVVSLLADKAWDIIDRKRAEETALRERDFVKAAMDSLPGLFYLFDQTGKFLSWNDNFEKVSGYSASEIFRMSPLEFFDSPGRELIAERIAECFISGKVDAEADFISRDGSRTPHFFTGKLFTYDGMPCLIGMGIDMTLRKRVEDALRESEQRLNLAIASSPIPIMIHDEEDRVLQLSAGWTKLSGYTLDDIPALSDWTELAYGERSGTEKKYIDDLFAINETVYNGEWLVKAKNGETRIWDFQTTPLGRVNRGNRVLLSIATDITERKQAEKSLSIQTRTDAVFLMTSGDDMFNEVLKIILEVMDSPFGVFGYLDETGGLVVPTMTRQIWDQCQIPEKTIRFPREKWGYSSWPRAILEKRVILSNEPSSDVPDGHIGISRHISLPILFQGKVIGLFQVANKKTDYTQEDIRTLESIAGHVAPILNSHFERNRLEEERRRFTEELERSNVDLQQFAYVASHDLQEPLRMISSYLQLLERRYKDKLDADANDFIGFAVDGASRLQSLINGLLEFSRVKTHGKPFESVNVKEILNGVRTDLAFIINESGAGIVYGDMPVIVADKSQIARVFQNLISNAIKFNNKEATPRIEISAETIGGECVFLVKDNGIGIEEQYFERIFTIFQRLHTRDEYPGAGIGLSICKRIVERHGGRMWIESKYGEGSSFYFSIPVK